MRKIFIIFLLGIISLMTFQDVQAITQNQINAEVQIVCPDAYGNWFSGSGTIIDPKGIILTNRHVVTDIKGGIIKTCYIGFINSIAQVPDFGTKNNPNIADVKYFTTTRNMDAAILYLSNPTNKNYTNINIWSSDSNKLVFGNSIDVIGYPSIGGSTITYTSGDFSGFGSVSDGTQNYIKSTAILEHGNSGGAAYSLDGQFIGVPTMVVSGELNSLSYILSVNSIKNWLYNIFGTSYEEKVIQTQPIIKQPASSIKVDITPPKITGYNINYKILNDEATQVSKIFYYWDSKNIISPNKIIKYFYYFGDSALADPMVDGKSLLAKDGINNISEEFVLNGIKPKYFILRIQDDKGNVSPPQVAPWDMKSIITMGTLLSEYKASNDQYKSTDYTILKKYSGLFVKNNGLVWYVNAKDSQRHLIIGSFDNSDYYGSALNGLFADSSVSVGILTKDLNIKPRHVWGTLLSEKMDDGVSMGGFYYIDPRNGKIYDFSSIINYKGDKFVMDEISKLVVDIPTSDLNKIKPANPINNYYIQNNLVPLYVDFALPDVNTATLIVKTKLNGYILLQVESHGEAWYVNPADQKRYYMKDGATAYQMMRNFGQGITDNDLGDIPSVDSTDEIKNATSICASNSLANRLKGKILLQVEQHGEAYYVYPKNCRMIYMKDGAAAYEIMRYLGLGITNADLEKIPMNQ